MEIQLTTIFQATRTDQRKCIPGLSLALSKEGITVIVQNYGLANALLCNIMLCNIMDLSKK